MLLGGDGERGAFPAEAPRRRDIAGARPFPSRADLHALRVEETVRDGISSPPRARRAPGVEQRSARPSPSRADHP